MVGFHVLVVPKCCVLKVNELRPFFTTKWTINSTNLKLLATSFL